MKKVLAILFVTILFTSCYKYYDDRASSNSSGSSCVNNRPWAKNNYRWKYEMINNIFDSLQITYTAMPGNSNAFKSVSVYDDGLFYPPLVGYVEYCGGKQYTFTDSTLKQSTKKLDFDLDAAIGTVWNVSNTSTQGNTVTGTNTLVTKSASITTPLGTFVCTEIKNSVTVNGQNYISNYFFNSAKGLIKVTGLNEYQLLSTNF